MIGEKKVLALIPARGGSKGLPGKNIRPLCGKPLIGWSIETALGSKYVDQVVVSTDDQKIADVAVQFGASVPFLRPPELATDTASTYAVVKHVLDFYRETLGCVFDLVVLLEPTSPLREEDDVDSMIETISEKWEEFDSIVTIGEVHEHPLIMKKIEGGQISPFFGNVNETARRQDLPVAYFPYGVAYIAKTSSLVAEQTFYTQRCTFHTIRRYQSYEVDDIYDFVCVEAIMRHERGLP